MVFEVPDGAHILKPNPWLDMGGLCNYAQELEAYINMAAASAEEQLELAHLAVEELDKGCEDLYYGQEVRLEGIFYIGVGEPSSATAVGQQSDLTVVEGVSLGFVPMPDTIRDATSGEVLVSIISLGHLIQVSSDFLPDTVRTLYSEGIVFGPLAITSLSLLKDAKHKEITDTLDQIDKSDEFAEDMDVAIFKDDSSIDFQELGNIFNRASETYLNPNVMSDYLTYINVTTDLKYKRVEVLCSANFEMSGDDEYTATIADELIIGTCLGLCVGPNCSFENDEFIETKYSQLFMAIEADYTAETDTRIVLVPAANIVSHATYTLPTNIDRS